MKHKVLSNKKSDILGIGFDLISYEAVMETIHRWQADDEYNYITITNPHSVMLCHRDERMFEATAGACLTVPDGIGIIMAANMLGYKNCGRVTGPTLMLKLCDLGRKYGYRHFFYGGAKGVAEKLAERLSDIYPCLNVVGTYCPPFRHFPISEKENIVRKINAAKPNILWISLGAPKQEKWMAAHLGRIQATAMIGVGAAFDFHSGNVKWCPNWTRRCGLEWAYRLSKEPKRMWRRNLDSPLFLIKVIQQRLSIMFLGRTKTLQKKQFSKLAENESLI